MVDDVCLPGVDVHASFGRTLAGQREAVFSKKLLDASTRRLLLIVNGHTPLNHLLERDLGVDRPVDEVAKLLQLGLIERVD